MKLDYESTISGVRQALNEKGFLPFGAIKLGKRTLPGITLHEAFRNSIGMKPDDSVYMYRQLTMLPPHILEDVQLELQWPLMRLEPLQK